MDKLTFAEEVRLPVINLARAALRFAQEIAYPRLNIPGYLQQIDQLANQAAAILPASSSPQRAMALADFLFVKQGFSGNVADYADPRNSFLNEVLARRRGIPISLAVIYLEVARRLELPAYGVNLPGHFIVGVGEGQAALLLDPFHGGRRLERAECAQLVAVSSGYDGPFQEEWLAPTPDALILVRMLNNLRLVYVRQESWPEAIAVLRFLRLLQPEMPDHRRDLGLIYFQRGEMRLAAQHLEQFVALAPDTPEATAVKQHLQSALNQWVRRN
jgi:regulator of sirC expression with transglutaminase-like and TPR domain